MSESIDSPETVSSYIERYVPLGRAGTPEDVAGVFAFLASRDAAFLTGESIVVDDGAGVLIVAGLFAYFHPRSLMGARVICVVRASLAFH
ncbi:SDR family oxidoreductase [Paenibacillus sp. J31TS4]|uniref:SDR family oxidoreductase n=1 Tax=Paenibacillus sp. J31TS4 TaxID=2807195 RepID=UPI001BCD419C|nr:SDR family oxidoreductase [Paenibacillus sp. J31TS4]